MSAVRCETFVFDGVEYWEAPDGQTVAGRFPLAGGWLVERYPSRPPTPPFAQLLPCPYCGVEEDREHDPLKHVDKRFGTPNGEPWRPARIAVLASVAPTAGGVS